MSRDHRWQPPITIGQCERCAARRLRQQQMRRRAVIVWVEPPHVILRHALFAIHAELNGTRRIIGIYDAKRLKYRFLDIIGIAKHGIPHDRIK